MPRGIKNTTTSKTDMKAKPIKKIFSLLVCVAVIFALFAFNCSAVTISDTVIDEGDYIYGYYNKNVHWSVTRSTGILCIFGEGDFYYAHHIEPFGEHIKTLSVGEGITSLQESALAGFPFERAELPDTLEYIGDFAFKNCKNLEKAVIPASVEYIGKGAFEGCESLDRIYIFSKNIVIEEGAFPENLDLKAVYFYGENIEIKSGNEEFKALLEGFEKNGHILPMIISASVVIVIIGAFLFFNRISKKEIKEKG